MASEQTKVATSGTLSGMRPFQIEVPEADLQDLRDRLERTRWPDGLPGVGWSYGIPLHYVRELVEYWRTKYDWRKQEALLNAFPQFTTNIDGANVHFIHAKSPEPDAMPLILTHGWPGSVVEFQKIIGPLTNPREHGGNPLDAFHVVAPSIPGFGFSGPTQQTGWNDRRVAVAWNELMQRLGYENYGAQGGDWGGKISRELGRLCPGRVIAVHLNYIYLLPPTDTAELESLTASDQAKLRASEEFQADGLAYAQLQSTRPQTLAYALTDSPIGQLAWIVEKFKEWTDSKERPEEAVDRDQMLTDVAIYWFTRTAGSSARLYYEGSRAGCWSAPEPSETPTGVAVFPREMAPAIRSIAEKTNNIVHWKEFDRGGHFPAMEQPTILTADIREFFRRFR